MSSLPPLAKLQNIPQQFTSLPYLNHPSSGICSPLHPGKFYAKATASRKLLWVYSCTNVSTSWPTLLWEWAHMSMTQSIYPAFYLQLTLICCKSNSEVACLQQYEYEHIHVCRCSGFSLSARLLSGFYFCLWAITKSQSYIRPIFVSTFQWHWSKTSAIAGQKDSQLFFSYFLFLRYLGSQRVKNCIFDKLSNYS